MPKKKIKDLKTIEQIDYDLRADNKLPSDKSYPVTEQNKQGKENVFKKNHSSNANEKQVREGVENEKRIEDTPGNFDTSGESKKINLEKTEKIKSEIKKFLSLRSF
ncbi:MAG: hypothetical protein M3R36_02050 [Bacteroidota bacterium]|nr:hypothetical protein [Bacteroidota bacterium]